MLNAIETYLTLRRVTGFAMQNAEYLLKSFCRLCGRAWANACPHANGNRLGSSRALRGATRCAAESRLPLCAPCPR